MRLTPQNLLIEKAKDGSDKNISLNSMVNACEVATGDNVLMTL